MRLNNNHINLFSHKLEIILAQEAGVIINGTFVFTNDTFTFVNDTFVSANGTIVFANDTFVSADGEIGSKINNWSLNYKRSEIFDNFIRCLK